MREALTYPRLGRMLAAYTINRLGSWIGLVALSLAVYDHTHSAVAVAGLLLSWQALPAFVVPAVVARVEASNGRHELSALYLFEAVVTAGLAVLLGHFWLPGLFALALLDGTATLAASALLRAEVARSGRDFATAASPPGAGRAELDAAIEAAEQKANAALNVAFSIAFVAGPLIGGVVTAAVGAKTALIVDVGSFLICAALLLDLHPHVEEAGGDSVRARLRTAWDHIRNVRALRALLLVETLALLFIQTAGPIEVVYAKSTLNAGDRGYGLLVSAWGAGAVLGSALFARASRIPLGVTLSAGTFALGAAFVGYAAAPTLALACVAAGIGGIGNTLEWPALITLVQRLTPQPLHGRLMGAVESLASITIAAGLALGGALVALSSPRTAFLIVGIGTTVAALLFVRLTVTTARPPATPAAGEEPGLNGQPPQAGAAADPGATADQHGLGA